MKVIQCSSVTRVALAENAIGDVGAVAISKLMKYNTALERIDLSKNPAITADGMSAIAKAFRINTSILSFLIDGSELQGSFPSSLPSFRIRFSGRY
jgi:hypothetical protein